MHYFYESMSISIGVKTSDGRQESPHNCVCIHGYIQPQPFLARYYPQLTESHDGLADRLLISFPKTHILMEEVIIIAASVLNYSKIRHSAGGG